MTQFSPVPEKYWKLCNSIVDHMIQVHSLAQAAYFMLMKKVWPQSSIMYIKMIWT